MRKLILSAAIILITAVVIYSCSTAEGMNQPVNSPLQLPVISLSLQSPTTFQAFSASVEGKTNVEIRPQVSGYLDKIYMEEGSYVKKGQPLFKINDRPYNEQSNNASANVLVAQANLEKASIEVNRLQILVENNVISDVQLKAARAVYNAANAQLKQAKALGNNANINLGYTIISAPVSGYIGKIPFKTGSLVGKGETLPLTVLSDVKDVYAYFSMSEQEFLHFTQASDGGTIDEKIKSMPAVNLQLADKTIYPEKGKIELMEGQFDKSMGTISFRAVFANPQGLLRSGSTGKVLMPQTTDSVLAVPQQSTYELQDKVYVFAVGDSNKVQSKPLDITGQSTGYYFVNRGLKAGEKIVFAGMDRLQDGTPISPQILSADSVSKAIPF